MLEFVNKVILLLQKRKLLTTIRMEHVFFHEFFADDLDIDEADLRGRLSKNHLIKNPTKEMLTENQDLEFKLNKYNQIRTRIKQSEQIEKELVAQIDMIFRNLFKSDYEV